MTSVRKEGAAKIAIIALLSLEKFRSAKKMTAETYR